MLDMSDVDRVTWLCQQLDPAQLLSQEPLPLSQSILLSLMQQLGSQLGKVSLHLEAANMMHSAYCSGRAPRWLWEHVTLLQAMEAVSCEGMMCAMWAAGYTGEAAVDQGGGAKSGPQ